MQLGNAVVFWKCRHILIPCPLSVFMKIRGNASKHNASFTFCKARAANEWPQAKPLACGLNFQQLVCAISKALGEWSTSVASGALTLDPPALCFLRFWTAPWPGLLLWRLDFWTPGSTSGFARLLDSRQRRRRRRFAAFLDSNSRRRRWRCRRCNLEQVWRPGLGCRKLRGFPRRSRFWRGREGLCRRIHAGRRCTRHGNHGFAARFC